MRLHPADNVAVLVGNESAPAGAVAIADGLPPLTLRQPIPRGHKVALATVPSGGAVIKFAQLIGEASQDIAPGDHVHTHNVVMPSPERANTHFGERVFQPPTSSERRRTFQGYLRPDGSAGVRNYVVVVASVNCSASVVKAVCRHFLGRDLAELGVDGVVPVTHASGCAQAIGGLGYQVLNRTLAGWIFHPNVVGAVVIGLGCEGTTLSSILAERNRSGRAGQIPLEHLNVQDVGGSATAIQQGIAAVERVLGTLPRFARTPLPVSHLKLALNCGGSDGLSGLTANPALGSVSDMLVNEGGTVALAEIPECHGAESLLYARAASPEVRESLRRVFEWWVGYADRHHVNLNNNLAPGNIAGGISTIIEKSLGAVAKGGSTLLTEVVDYAEPIRRTGFTLMNTPGFDPVSVTGLVAGGCNLVAFTTGRGSVYGCGIAPTLKIATNSEVFHRMSGDMDFDAGEAVALGSVAPIADRLYDLTLEVASGRRTHSEELGLGWEEFVPWPVGETL